MAFRFRKRDRSVAHAVRRIVREQVDKAIAAVEDEDDVSQAVHEVRRRCKNVRGVLRLVRKSFPTFAEEDASFRETAHLLAGLRDAQVMHDTFDRLTKKYGQIDNGWHKDFRRGLKANADSSGGNLDARIRLGEARALLVEARKRTKDWSLKDDGWPAIGPGVELAYAGAVQVYAEIDDSPSDKLFHELRKHVRYHWNHLRLLRRTEPKFLRPRIALAGDLADQLGKHHDLAVFEQTVRADPSTFGKDRDVEATLILARRYRTMMEQRALREARKLLVLDPVDYVARLGEDWRGWKR